MPRKYTINLVVSISTHTRNPEFTLLKVLQTARQTNEITDFDITHQPSKDTEAFRVVDLHRDDLTIAYFDASKVSDERMKKIAESMGQAYIESGDFFESLRDICQHYGVPSTKQE